MESSRDKQHFFINNLQPILKDTFQLLDTGSVPNWVEWDDNLPVPDGAPTETIPFGSQDTQLFFLKSAKSKKLVGYTTKSGLNKFFLPKGICGLACPRPGDTQFPISSETNIYTKYKTLFFDIQRKYIQTGISSDRIAKEILHDEYIIFKIEKNNYLIGEQIWLSRESSEILKDKFKVESDFNPKIESVFDTGTNMSLTADPGSKTYERLKSAGGGVPKDGWNLIGFNFISKNISRFYVDYDNSVLAILPLIMRSK